jgi:hypothetical protein|tara:strand:+ start:389 stop:619 length:231 start_codon:yes stop_codon:yes gene_type:complete
MKIVIELDNLTDDHLDRLIGEVFTRDAEDNNSEVEKLGFALSQEWRRRNPEALPPSIVRNMGLDCQIGPDLNLDDD